MIPESPDRAGRRRNRRTRPRKPNSSSTAFLEKERFRTRWEWAGSARHSRLQPLGARAAHRRQPAKFYLVGDAAAQVKVSTVGGIVTGFSRSLWRRRRDFFEKNTSELRTLRRETWHPLAYPPRPAPFQASRLFELVDLLNASTRESLGEINRDEVHKAPVERSFAANRNSFSSASAAFPPSAKR